VVDRVTAAVYEIPTDQPEADGTLAWSKTTLVTAQVTGGGGQGLGYTYAAGACKPLIEGELAAAIAGRSVLDTAAAAQAMVRAVRNIGRPGLVSYAISAVDTALWDLKAKLLCLPVSRLLGLARDDVPVYGSGGFTTYDDAAARAQLEHWVGDQRIGRVKIKIGESCGTREARDLARIAFARKVIGPDTELYVDANGGYTRKQAVRVARAAAEHNVTWFEEPVSSDDLDGLREVRGQVEPDVTAGEYGYDLPYFARMVDAQAVDCLQVDVTRCGGITEWLRAAAIAAARGLQVSGHCAPSLHAHVAAAVPNLRHLEYFHDHVRIETMLFDGALDPSGGLLHPDPSRPGLGLALKESIAAPYRTALPPADRSWHRPHPGKRSTVPAGRPGGRPGLPAPGAVRGKRRKPEYNSPDSTPTPPGTPETQCWCLAGL
jgi:L-alanine-DL-glutamate epimerase-like enolase superfamily enzyme